MVSIIRLLPLELIEHMVSMDWHKEIAMGQLIYMEHMVNLRVEIILMVFTVRHLEELHKIDVEEIKSGPIHLMPE